MIMPEKMIQTDKVLIQNLCDIISNAIGDDIQEDVRSQGLIVHNSTPIRIWDHLYTNLCKKFVGFDIVARSTRRGSWDLVPIFERSTGFLYVVMRESRFKILKKEAAKRKTPHYAEALAKTLNKDLIATQYQVPLIEVTKEASEGDDYIRKIVQKIFNDLSVPDTIVKRHGLILFNDVNGVLLSLRCCIVDSHLNTVEEANWNEYIKASESIIAEEVIDETSIFNDPTNGLKYRQKAKDKMDQRRLTKEKIEVEQQTDLR